MTLDPIDSLLSLKLGRLVEKYRNVPQGDRVLVGKLKKLMSKEVEALLRLNGLVNPPIDPFKIHEIEKVPIIIEFEQGIGSNGTIEVVNGKFVIKLESSLLKTKDETVHGYRLRSTAAHELMHTFFYDTSVIPPRKLGSGSPTRRKLLMQEELCFYLARQFLMPTFSIRKQLIISRQLKNPSIRNTKFLKSKYDVSSEIVAYRLIKDLRLWNAIFLKFAIEDGSYKAVMRLKAENKYYDKLRTPQIIPTSAPSDWEKALLESLRVMQTKANHKEVIEVLGKKTILDIAYDSKNPVSIIVVAYETEEKSLALNKFLQTLFPEKSI
jgi:Zn-dependent peptidase ImmA (M78 family)